MRKLKTKYIHGTKIIQIIHLARYEPKIYVKNAVFQETGLGAKTIQARVPKMILSTREATHIDKPARSHKKREFDISFTTKKVLISTY